MRIGALSRYIPSHRSTAPTKSRTGARNSVWPPSGLYLTRPRLVRTADTLGTGNMVTAGVLPGKQQSEATIPTQSAVLDRMSLSQRCIQWGQRSNSLFRRRTLSRWSLHRCRWAVSGLNFSGNS